MAAVLISVLEESKSPVARAMQGWRVLLSFLQTSGGLEEKAAVSSSPAAAAPSGWIPAATQQLGLGLPAQLVQKVNHRPGFCSVSLRRFGSPRTGLPAPPGL